MYDISKYNTFDYKWLSISSFILLIIICHGKHNAYDNKINLFNVINGISNHTNNIIASNETPVSDINHKISFSRPSNVLRQLWSTALTTDTNNVSNNTLQDITLRNLLMRPTKWSSHIVPSIPLGFQLSNDAIKLSPKLLNETKTTTKGDITVINGLMGSSVSYPPRNYQILDRKTENTNKNQLVLPKPTYAAYSAFTDIDDTLSTLESAAPIVTVPINATDIPMFNITHPLKIKTTMATIVSPFEITINSKIQPLIETTTLYTSRSTTTTTVTTISPLIDLPINSTQQTKLSSSELRRQAIRQHFGQPDRQFGLRITRTPSQTPPRVSIDNLISAYKPFLGNYYINHTNKALFTPKPNIITNVTKVLTPIHKTVSKFVKHMVNKTQVNGKRDPMMTSENRHFMSTHLIFPSRQTPTLKPKLISVSNDCPNNKLTEYVMKLLNASRNNITVETLNAKNVDLNDIISRLQTNSSNNFRPTISRRDEFGLRNNEIEILRNKKDLNNTNNRINQYKDIQPITDSSIFETNTQHMSGGTDLNDEQPIIEDTDYIDKDIPLSSLVNESPNYMSDHEILETHKQYMNALKDQQNRDKHNILPNPELFKAELNKPEDSVKIFGLSLPEANNYNNHNKPTLPNKMMKFDSMMKELAKIMRSISKLSPLGKELSDKYKDFAQKVKNDISINKEKGTYAQYYPPGYYDDIYTPDKVEENNRRSDNDMTVHYLTDPLRYNQTLIDDIDTDKNNSYTYNDYDEDGLIKKTFGYKVTVYESPNNDKSNVTEEELTDDKDLNDNNSDDLTGSESSADYSLTTDNNGNTNNATQEEPLTLETNLLKSESQSGNDKGMDYKRVKYNKDRSSQAKESVNVNKNKKIDSHDKRANNERALKERTVIEFFEREQILDSAYNKDKLGVDKGADDGGNYGEHTSGSMTNTVIAPDGTVSPSGTLTVADPHQYSDSQQTHATNGHTFDTVFPESDRKYKHKDNAHKYKGWKERGYKIITETEFVDRGRKVDTTYKTHTNGSKSHTKMHSAGDVTKGDTRQYHQNIKNIDNHYDPLYGNRIQTSPISNEEDKQGMANNKNRNTILFSADNYNKYFNNGIKSGESQQQFNVQKPTFHTKENISSEQTWRKPSIVRDIKVSSSMTTGFRMPNIDTKSKWRPITTTDDHWLHNNQAFYGKNTKTNNNFKENSYENQNLMQKIENAVNADIESNNNKMMETIDSSTYGNDVNPYSLPLISEVIPYDSDESPNNVRNVATSDIQRIKSNPQYYQNQQYFYQSIPKEKTQNLDINDNQNYDFNLDVSKTNNNDNNDHKITNYINTSFAIPTNESKEINFYDRYYPNQTYVKPINNDYSSEQQIASQYKTAYDMRETVEEPIPTLPIPTNNPYFHYHIKYPTGLENSDTVEKYIKTGFNGRPIIALTSIADKQVSNKVNKLETSGNTVDKIVDNNGIHLLKSQNYAKNINNNKYQENDNKQKLHTFNENTYVRPIKINTKIEESMTKPFKREPKSKVKSKTTNIKKRPKVYPSFVAKPLMPPIIDGLYLSSTPMQTMFNPYGVRTTALPPVTQLPVQVMDTHFATSNERPVAILHPNKMLTITTTGLLRNKFDDHIWSKKYSNPLQYILNGSRHVARTMNHRPQKLSVNGRQRSVNKKFNLISSKFLQTKRNIKENRFSVKKWLTSKLSKNKSHN